MLLLQPVAFAQSATSPVSVSQVEQPLPKDASALLALAGQVNGLRAPGLKPWHIKASYETRDRQGQPSGHGTFEVFWAGPKKYKTVITSDAFTQTEYGTESGIYRSGNPTAVPYPQAYLIDQVLHPMPNQDDIDEARPELREQAFGAVPLQCVMLSQKVISAASAPLGLFPTYCFSPEKPILRYSTYGGGIGIIFNQLVLFHDRYLAKQITVKDKNIPIITIQIDQVNDLGDVDEEFFRPSADAVNPHDGPATVAPAVMSGAIVTKVPPIYPPSAKFTRASGRVLLEAIIGKDGRIHRLRVLESPDPALTVAALVAAQQWEYKPYMLNGEPVEVKTTITINFRMRG